MIWRQRAGTSQNIRRDLPSDLVSEWQVVILTPTCARHSYTVPLPTLFPTYLPTALLFSPPSLLTSSTTHTTSTTMSRDTDMHTEHSKPIPINTRRARAHSVSESSSSEESCSPSSPVSPLQSPLAGNQPRIAPVSPGATPILSYFLSQSPKTPSSATFPFRRGFGTAVFDGTYLSFSLLMKAHTS